MPFNKIQLDVNGGEKLQGITAIYNSLESALMLLTDCREKSLAITNLEQSYLWMEKTIEREQLERNFKAGQVMPPQPNTQSKMSSSAILADSKAKLDGLAASIKELTDAAALKGFSIK